MTTDHINAELDCPNCKASPAALDLPNPLSGQAIVKCRGCGYEFGTVDALRQAIAAKSYDELASIARDIFKGIKR